MITQKESKEDPVDHGDSNFRLEQISLIAVNNLSDIFIYYISAIFSKQQAMSDPTQFQLMAQLWLNLLFL